MSFFGGGGHLYSDVARASCAREPKNQKSSETSRGLRRLLKSTPLISPLGMVSGAWYQGVISIVGTGCVSPVPPTELHLCMFINQKINQSINESIKRTTDFSFILKIQTKGKKLKIFLNALSQMRQCVTGHVRWNKGWKA